MGTGSWCIPLLLLPIHPAASLTLPPGRGRVAEAEETNAQLPPALVAVAQQGGLQAAAAAHLKVLTEKEPHFQLQHSPSTGMGGSCGGCRGAGGPAPWGATGLGCGPRIRAASCLHYPQSLHTWARPALGR